MQVFTLIFTFAGLALAIPQKCSTVTTEVIAPSKTRTYSTTEVTTLSATGAMDLGTFTSVSTISSTNVLFTITTTTTSCGASGTVSVPVATITVYSGDARKRAAGENRKRASCTVTKTTTRKYGETLILVPAGVTSTYTAYTDFSMATVTETTYRGTKHIIATETATTSSVCGPATTSIATWTSTVSLDRRCAPAAMTVDGNGFGIDWLSDVPSTGATYETETENASFCCQLCAETDKCAASAWDIRNGRCKLEFPTAWDTGELSCGQGLLGYYAAGPNHPMSPGAGWYISELCGWVQLTNAKPDDGS